MEIENSQFESEESIIPLEEIIKCKEEFYETTKKNLFFKKAQKRDCAELISNRFDIVELMNHTFWIIPNKNILYFDYRIFRLYGHPDNYKNIIENVIRFCIWCVSEYGNFVISVNLAAFTVSGAERYRDFILRFCEECMKDGVPYSDKLLAMNLYNIPNSVDQISRLLLPLIPLEVRPKLQLYRKDNSDDQLKQLYEDSGKIYTP